jgi:hypothetical protein
MTLDDPVGREQLLLYNLENLHPRRLASTESPAPVISAATCRSTARSTNQTARLARS